MPNYTDINKSFGVYKVFDLINANWNTDNPISPVPKICYPNQEYKETANEYWIKTRFTIGERLKYQGIGDIQFILTCPANKGAGNGLELMAFLGRIVDEKQIDNVWTDRLTIPVAEDYNDSYIIVANLIFHVNFCGI